MTTKNKQKSIWLKIGIVIAVFAIGVFVGAFIEYHPIPIHYCITQDYNYTTNKIFSITFFNNNTEMKMNITNYTEIGAVLMFAPYNYSYGYYESFITNQTIPLAIGQFELFGDKLWYSPVQAYTFIVTKC